MTGKMAKWGMATADTFASNTASFGLCLLRSRGPPADWNTLGYAPGFSFKEIPLPRSFRALRGEAEI